MKIIKHYYNLYKLQNNKTPLNFFPSLNDCVVTMLVLICACLSAIFRQLYCIISCNKANIICSLSGEITLTYSRKYSIQWYEIIKLQNTRYLFQFENFSVILLGFLISRIYSFKMCYKNNQKKFLYSLIPWCSKLIESSPYFTNDFSSNAEIWYLHFYLYFYFIFFCCFVKKTIK